MLSVWVLLLLLNFSKNKQKHGLPTPATRVIFSSGSFQVQSNSSSFEGGTCSTSAIEKSVAREMPTDKLGASI